MMPTDFSPLMLEVQQWMLQMSDQQRLQKLMEWSEEQPHMFGFLVNLADDFPSREHQALSLLPLVIQESFRRMGMSVDAIAPDLLEKCIEEQVEYAEKKSRPRKRAHACCRSCSASGSSFPIWTQVKWTIGKMLPWSCASSCLPLNDPYPNSCNEPSSDSRTYAEE